MACGAPSKLSPRRSTALLAGIALSFAFTILAAAPAVSGSLSKSLFPSSLALSPSFAPSCLALCCSLSSFQVRVVVSKLPPNSSPALLPCVAPSLAFHRLLRFQWRVGRPRSCRLPAPSFTFQRILQWRVVHTRSCRLFSLPPLRPSCGSCFGVARQLLSSASNLYPSFPSSWSSSGVWCALENVAPQLHIFVCVHWAAAEL